MDIVPINFDETCEFINQHHRHHIAPQGHKFSIGLSEDNDIIGVVVVGRPVARYYDDGFTAEITRCCVKGQHKNACSMLYGAAWRAAKAMGYRRIVTYTLDTEKGSSLKGAGYKVLHKTAGGTWSWDGRPRVDKHPLQAKLCWEKTV